MIVAHLPAGYMLARLSHARFAASIGFYRTYVACALAGALAPDLDLTYFYLIDGRSTHHHKYFPHFPLVWALMMAATASLLLGRRIRLSVAPYALVFAASGFLHMLLDSVVGDIWWLAPYVDRPFSLATVEAYYTPWWLNFIVHWSFLLEVAIVLWAVALWRLGKPATTTRAVPT